MICLFFSITLWDFFLISFEMETVFFLKKTKIVHIVPPFSLICPFLVCFVLHVMISSFCFQFVFYPLYTLRILFQHWRLGEFFPLLLLLPPVIPHDFVTSRFAVLYDE